MHRLGSLCLLHRLTDSRLYLQSTRYAGSTPHVVPSPRKSSRPLASAHRRLSYFAGLMSGSAADHRYRYPVKRGKRGSSQAPEHPLDFHHDSDSPTQQLGSEQSGVSAPAAQPAHIASNPAQADPVSSQPRPEPTSQASPPSGHPLAQVMYSVPDKHMYTVMGL